MASIMEFTHAKRKYKYTYVVLLNYSGLKSTKVQFRESKINIFQSQTQWYMYSNIKALYITLPYFAHILEFLCAIAEAIQHLKKQF